MSSFSSNIGPEEEDGAGWDGLLPTKEEREEETRQKRAQAQEAVKAMEIAEYRPTAAALATLAQKYGGVAFDLTTTAGDKEARSARLELVRLRTSLEAKRKELKAPALAHAKLIDTEAERIRVAIEALETPIDEQIKADEARREQIRAEERRKEEERAEADRIRIASIRARINAIINTPARSVGKTSEQVREALRIVGNLDVGEHLCAEFAAEAMQARAEAIALLDTLLADTIALEERAAEVLRAAEAQRQEQARRQLEADEEKRVAEALRLSAAEQMRAIAAENARRLEAEHARLRAEAAERQAKIDAENKRVTDTLVLERLKNAHDAAIIANRIAELKRQEDELAAARAKSERLERLAEERCQQPLALDKIPEGLNSQHVLKAEAARPDATDRDASADDSPGGGPMGAWQPAAAGHSGQDAHESALAGDARPCTDPVAEAAQTTVVGDEGQAAHAEERAAEPAQMQFWMRCIEAECVVVPVKMYAQFTDEGGIDEMFFTGIKFAALEFNNEAVGPDYWFMLEDSATIESIRDTPEDAIEAYKKDKAERERKRKVERSQQEAAW